MNNNVLNLTGSLVVALMAGVAFSTDYYVSEDGSWPASVASAKRFTSINAALWKDSALSSSRIVAGDTVWVKDGYVCENGQTGEISSNGGRARVKLNAVKFTLRSESGYVDEASGKGAYIRGNKESLVPSAIRPIWAQNAAAVIMGFVLEDGGTGYDATSPGAAIYGPALVTNCIIRNCTAYTGGAFGSGGRSAAFGAVYDSVISNCQAVLGVGGIVSGGTSFYRCMIANNRAKESGGAIDFDGVKLTKYAPVYSACTFVGNEAGSGGCAHFANGGKTATFDHCQILDNVATGSGTGGVEGNATLLGCVLSGNKAASGAAAFSTESTTNCFNCAFVNNVSESGCIVSGPLDLLNCTVARNTSGGNCVIGITFKNSIIWKNKYEGLELAGCTATYSCQKDLTTGMGNITTDPKLTTDNRLSVDSPCVGTAKFETWMTAGDVRSFDAAGYPRLRRSLPDMGAYALENPGAMVIGR